MSTNTQSQRTSTFALENRVINSLEELEQEAKLFVDAISENTLISNISCTQDRATLITLSGELGAGKTTFTQFVAKALGITDVVNSPTFVLEKIYKTNSEKFSQLIHIDAYRLQSADDLLVLNFAELLDTPKTLILLEWPERVEGIAEQATVQITLELLHDGSRQITYGKDD